MLCCPGIMLKLAAQIRQTSTLSVSFVSRSTRTMSTIKQSRATPRRAICLDYDNTITTQDTISVLLSYAVKHHSLRSQTPDSHSRQAPAEISIEIVNEYMDDYTKHLEQYRPNEEDRKSLAEEIAWQRSLKDVESRSIRRINESGLFNEISNEQWRLYGIEAVATKGVAIRDGLWKRKDIAAENDHIWAIVSVNFAQGFILGTLEHSGHTSCFGALACVASNVSDIDGITGYNDVAPAGKLIMTSDDKLYALRSLIESWNKDGSDVREIVYVGDSGTDIECLNAKDVIGIIMTPDGKGKLMQTMKRIGVEVVHIREYRCATNNEGLVYWARDFVEIEETLLCS